jgi:hypothetical protein
VPTKRLDTKQLTTHSHNTASRVEKMKMTKTKRRRRAPKRSPFHVIDAAFHEAGHVIAALALGIHIVRVSVLSSGSVLGSCRVIPPAGHEYGGQRLQRATAQKYVVMAYAGPIAERMVKPSAGVGTDSAEVFAHELAVLFGIYGGPGAPDNEEDYLALMNALRREAEQLIARHRQGVALLAAELLRVESMSGAEVEAWARRNYLPAAYVPAVDLCRVSDASTRSPKKMSHLRKKR